MTILNPIVVPPNTTLAAAMSAGLLPDQVQIGSSGPNPTLLSQLSNGTLSMAALYTSVTTGQYGGS